MGLRSCRRAGAVALIALLCPGAARAETFCDRLRTILDAAPSFTALRGAPQGEDFIATTTIAGAPQCTVNHPSGAPGSLAALWSYRCDWPNLGANSVPWFKQQITACYSGQYWKDAAELGISGLEGGLWSLAGFNIGYFYDPKARVGELIVEGERTHFLQ